MEEYKIYDIWWQQDALDNISDVSMHLHDAKVDGAFPTNDEEYKNIEEFIVDLDEFVEDLRSTKNRFVEQLLISDIRRKKEQKLVDTE